MLEIADTLPERIADVEALDELLSRPSLGVIEAIRGIEGPLMILGVGGKMGPTLARMAVRAAQAAGSAIEVLGVSRFSETGLRERLEAWGVRTIACDLLDEAALAALPDAPNIVYMAGHKFGASTNQPLTWAMNTFLPGLVARRFAGARLVAFSSGNVYPLVPVASGGATEETAPNPVGEYAMSVLGRERILAYWAGRLHSPTLLLRLNYAAELRYGVLLDVAQKVWRGEPVDVTMGHANVIWQGDANAAALQALALADVPPVPLNLTGPETCAVRGLAEEFGQLLDREPQIVGDEQPTALLSNARRAHEAFGYPRVPLGRAIGWVADWVRAGGPTLDKPTKFQVREGRF